MWAWLVLVGVPEDWLDSLWLGGRSRLSMPLPRAAEMVGKSATWYWRVADWMARSGTITVTGRGSTKKAQRGRYAVRNGKIMIT